MRFVCLTVSLGLSLMPEFEFCCPGCGDVALVDDYAAEVSHTCPASGQRVVVWERVWCAPAIGVVQGAGGSPARGSA